MKLSEAVKFRISELMKLNNIETIHQLSIISGIPYASINDYFKDRTGLPRLDKLVHICEAINIDLVDFFNSPVFKNTECDD